MICLVNPNIRCQIDPIFLLIGYNVWDKITINSEISEIDLAGVIIINYFVYPGSLYPQKKKHKTYLTYDLDSRYDTTK